MADFPNTTSASGIWNAVDQYKAQAGLNWPSPEDPNFGDNVLLMSTNNFNNSTNNVFVDTSGNGYSITKTGNVTQGSFSPYGDGWSCYFNGSSYLNVADSPAIELSNLSFTIEAWIKPRVLSGTQVILGKWLPSAYAFLFYIVDGGFVKFAVNNGVYATTTFGITAGVWNHVALTRSAGGNIWNMWINGVLAYSGNHNVTISDDGTAWNIGRNPDSNTYYFTGYISNLRVIKGLVLYTSNFIPTTSPLTPTPETVLLTCNSNSFVDSSVNKFEVTRANDVVITKFNPFRSTKYSPSTYGGSMYFNGSSYLTVPFNENTALYSNNFTIDCWVYTQIVDAGRTIVSNSTGNTDNNYFQLAILASGAVQWQVRDTSSQYLLTSTTVLKTKSWYHVAVTRNGTTFSIYINGKLENSSTSSKALTRRNINIGSFLYTGFENYWYGYISDLRIVKGSVLYNTNFDIPNLPAQPVENTVLLMQGTNAGIYDSTGGTVISTVGDTKTSTNQSLWDSGTAYFDGTGDYLITNYDYHFSLPSNADWTLELWLYTTNFNTSKCLVFCSSGVGAPALWNTSHQFALYILETTGVLVLEYSNGTVTAPVIFGVTPLNLNTWNHVAVVYTGATKTVNTYVNGVADLKAASMSTYNPPAVVPCITVGRTNPAVDASTSYHFDGYIEDLRITVGKARYNSSFSPLLPKIKPVAGTELLLQATDPQNWLVDNSDNNHAITPYGDVIYSTLAPPGGAGSYYFDGSGDGLSTVLSNAIGTDDFTIECWIYPTGIDAAPNYNNYGVWVDMRTSGSSEVNLLWGFIGTGSQPLLFVNGSFVITGSAVPLNNWTHMALCRSNNITKMFINGVQTGASYLDPNNYSNNFLRIGINVTNNNFFKGYISNYLFLKGTALYTTNFNKPILTQLPRN